jgi:hypothetical protein
LMIYNIFTNDNYYMLFKDSNLDSIINEILEIENLDLVPMTSSDWIYNVTNDGKIRKYALNNYWTSIRSNLAISKEESIEIAKEQFWILVKTRLGRNQR